MPMLEAHDLAAQRGHARLFSGVALSVPPGHVLAVSGPNGSGKTTLLRMLAGLTAPAAGVIRLLGKAVIPFDPRLRASVAFVGHLPALKDELTAGENLASLVALSDGDAKSDRIAAALDTVALSKHATLPARALSQGQRRRIGLARLALCDKPLWILDEPATALDADATALLTRMVRDHLDANGCAIVATHQPLDLPAPRTSALALG
jgi:heme exporter protein A